MGLASSSSSAPSSFPATHILNQHQRKYDVFLSFRGEDTRDNFISHLLAALSEKGVGAFTDYQLRRGDEIAPVLLQAIQESNVAVVVFSQNYASSSWCLDELVKIMECRDTRGQIVMPVFYRVDPSDVRKQSGSFAEASDRKRKRSFEINSDKVPKWKDALTRAANLSGWDSNVIRPERKLIDEIVKDVLAKLPLPRGLERLVGINSRIEEIKSLLSIGSQDTRILGIWGMGGIGKTTIAEIIFSQISRQFEGCCFLKNVREESERSGMQKLLEELMWQALGDRHISIVHRPRLRCKQILIVLDDVDNPQQLEDLVGDPCWFGRGSRIIVTSRNKQAFESRADYIYEVKPLDPDAALHLFSQYAFKQNHPLEGHKPLSDVVVRYCQGNPLALKVLGSSLFGRNKDQWESAINKLKKVPRNEIQKVLKISYDSLDREEKEIFLHIACFFKGYGRFTVIQILNSCGFSAEIGIQDLIDKSMLHSSLEMHDLLQEMGREFVREESKEPGERSRLWDPQDIYQVFMNNTGTRKVEGIFLDMSKLSKEIHLNPKAFENMSNLKFLKFYYSRFAEFMKLVKGSQVHLSQGLDYLPNELRYLYWHGYPLEYLPADFCSENLLSVELPCSKIKGFSKEAEPEIIVKHCSSLRQFSNLTRLSLRGCTNFTSLPNLVDMRYLNTLDLRGCTSLNIFPQVSRNMKDLYLGGTAIKEVPSFVEYMDQLVILHLRDCSEIVSFPADISKLKCLEVLNLWGCFKLKVFPEIRESMGNLVALYFGRVVSEERPSRVDNLKGLTDPLTSWLGKCCLKLPGLSILNLKYSNLEQLPADLGCLSSLKGLDLAGNNLESISESIKQLTQLEFLSIRHCRRLQSLPELPASLYGLFACGCTSLEDVSSLDQLLFDVPFLELTVDLQNCFKVDKSQRDPISRFRSRYPVKRNAFSPRVFFCYPGDRIPEWCVNQSTGDTVRIPLPSNWLTDAFLGFIFCLVIAGDFKNWADMEIRLNWHFGDDCDDGGDFYRLRPPFFSMEPTDGEHVVLLHDSELSDRIKDRIRPRLTQRSYDAVSIDFRARYLEESSLEVKKWGAIPWYAQD